ncbi:LOW QUALITY PROTEIN: MYCBP-associated protein [Boleophthalmus pectinirostris]|uniref:LOW QUALITY PROTEIN: MYCBP-associated protein n=1 Tax=Boleophthalmus pectinirostris TaxID=150288 RepID=UPI002432DD6B|nr:LOW QUALITY PROTEIN: MYCBP-associated protein [Boleophthalmus pectinirostris]
MKKVNTSELGVSELIKAADSRQASREPDWFIYDNQGMILPHSILGSLEDFRIYVEAKGKTRLLKKIPDNDHLYEALRKHKFSAVEHKSEVPPGVEENALEHWNTHMRLRRRQQSSLSGSLSRPVENLLMNHANRFRETQEKREMLSQVLPLVQSGYGHCVGSEFWRLPQHYGDEMSGIAATLTKTERGIQEPSAQVGLPCSIRQESGLKDTACHASRAWDQSIYLKEQCQKLGEIVQEVDFNKPNMDKLEVIGSSKPFSTLHCSNALLEDHKEKEPKDTHEDLVLQNNDMEPEPKKSAIPALRISGQLANWTGNSNTNQGLMNVAQVGINATLLFEGPTGELQRSHLDLHNEGTTAIFYSWQQLPLPQHFPHLLPCIKRPHFYFSSSSGVILPGDTKKIDFIFKSDSPGIQTELWQLNTHPVLLQGAPIHVTLRGVALYQDKTADYRLYIEKRLEKVVTLKICQAIVYEMVQGIHSPDRPSSPAELHQTEEQEFLYKNPKICYKNQPVEQLKKLWHQVKPKSHWDLSVGTLRQALLSLPVTKTDDDCLNQDTGLAQLNSVLLQLSEPSPKMHSATITTIGQLLWRDPLDTLTSEAVRLTHLLQLSEKATWMDKIENKQEDISLDHDLSPSISEEKTDKKGRTSIKEEKTVTPIKQSEDRKKGRESRTDLGKPRKNRHSKESDLHLQEQASEGPASDINRMDIYTRLLHQKVYGLIENLVESLCVLTDEEASL